MWLSISHSHLLATIIELGYKITEGLFLFYDTSVNHLLLTTIS